MVTPMARDVTTGPATVTTGLMSTAIIKAVNRATGIVTGAGITTETMAADEKGGFVPPFFVLWEAAMRPTLLTSCAKDITLRGASPQPHRDISVQPGLQSGITFESDCSAWVQLTGLNWN
jgi:hypothetical protein